MATADDFHSDTQNAMSDADRYDSDRPNASDSQFAKYPTRIEFPPPTTLQSLLLLGPTYYNNMMRSLTFEQLELVRCIAQRWPTQGETNVVIANAHTTVVANHVGMMSGMLVGCGVVLYPPAMTRLFRRFPRLPAVIKFPTVVLGFPITGLLGGTIMSNIIRQKRLATDPRMKSLRQEIRNMDRNEYARRAKMILAQRQQRDSRGSASSKPVSGTGSSMPQEESLPAGSFESDYDILYDRQQEDSKTFREVYSRHGEGERPSSGDASMYQTQYGQSPMQQQQQPQQTGQRSKDGGDMFGDDASPSSSSNTAPTPDVSSGSVWDRIRQQARSSQQRQTNHPQQQGSRWAEIQDPQTTQPNQFDASQSSSWSISPSSYPPQGPSQDTNSEREKAQREFDALLERERSFGAGPSSAGQGGNQSDRWGR